MLSLNAAQHIFINKLDTKFMAYVGGFGSGKTFVGCIYMLLWHAMYPGTTTAYYGVTYQAIKDIFYETFEEAATLLGFTIEIKYASKEIHIYRDGCYYGMILCRTLDKPERIVGYKISLAMVDELDTLKKEKAKHAWNKIIARLRLVIPGVQNRIIVTTTPEGYGFVYERFKDEPSQSYSMVQASTYENAKYLPDDYISSLHETYPEELIDAYCEGNFVNLTTGTVYSSFNRKIHNSSEKVEKDEDLIVGMDFNMNKMAAVIIVVRYHKDTKQREWHVVDEISKPQHMKNTETVCIELKKRYPNNKITVYPDSSGKSGNTAHMKGASPSDIAIITHSKYGFGFRCRFKSTNPRVKNRVMAVNKAFELGKLFVNCKKAKHAAKCLEQQAYNDKGEPDKTQGNDHSNDALGYPVAFVMPIVKPIRKLPVGYGKYE